MQPKETLQTARKAQGLKQSEAAARCGSSLSAWQKWETGANTISPAALAGCLLLLGRPANEALAAAETLIGEAVSA